MRPKLITVYNFFYKKIGGETYFHQLPLELLYQIFVRKIYLERNPAIRAIIKARKRKADIEARRRKEIIEARKRKAWLIRENNIFLEARRKVLKYVDEYNHTSRNDFAYLSNKNFEKLIEKIFILELQKKENKKLIFI